MTPGSARLALFLPWNAAEAERIVQSGFCKQTVYSRIWHVNNAARRQNTMQLALPAAAVCYQMSKHPRRQHSFSCCSNAAAHAHQQTERTANKRQETLHTGTVPADDLVMLQLSLFVLTFTGSVGRFESPVVTVLL